MTDTLYQVVIHTSSGLTLRSRALPLQDAHNIRFQLEQAVRAGRIYHLPTGHETARPLNTAHAITWSVDPQPLSPHTGQPL